RAFRDAADVPLYPGARSRWLIPNVEDLLTVEEHLKLAVDAARREQTGFELEPARCWNRRALRVHLSLRVVVEETKHGVHAVARDVHVPRIDAGARIGDARA